VIDSVTLLGLFQLSTDDVVLFCPQVPIPLPVKRQQFLAVKWLIHAARARKKHGMSNNLAAELLDAYNNQVFVSLEI